MKTWTHKGLTCIAIIRDHLHIPIPCGYVEVPKDHPWHNLHYSDPPLHDVDVHGGLTFGPDPLIIFNNHTTLFIGFDCWHSGDHPDDWPMENLEKEVNRLAEQVAAAAL